MWIVSVIVVIAAEGSSDDNVYSNITNFESFLGVYEKNYKAKYRMDRRKRAFKRNMQEIEEHNAIHAQGGSTFIMGVNDLADMDRSSYLKKMVRMTDTIHRRKIDVQFADDMVEATRRKRRFADADAIVQATQNLMPDSLDWRDKGYVTPDINQKTCGSCYAFSIAHAIDGQIMRRIGRVEFVSPQQIVDCSTSAGNKGCAGGSLRYTLQYLQGSGGCMRDSDYPYTSSQGTCGFNADLAICNISDWGILPKKEDALAFALWKVGPLAVSLNAAPSSFQLYQSGIYDSTDCTSATLNHAMLLVGYTPTYWIIKNWWSKTWGENGYMRMVRGKNMCGISNYAAYCTIK